MNDDLIIRQRLLKELKHRKELFSRNRIEFLGLSKNDKARVDEIDNCIAMVINAPSAQKDTCDGSKNKGKWENEVEYGCSSPCTVCKRRVNDNYEWTI